MQCNFLVRSSIFYETDNFTVTLKFSLFIWYCTNLIKKKKIVTIKTNEIFNTDDVWAFNSEKRIMGKTNFAIRYRYINFKSLKKIENKV